MVNLRSMPFRQNPYPYFCDLRQRGGVCRVEPHGFMAIFQYEDVLALLKNHEIFSSAGIGEEFAKTGPELLLSSRGMLGADRPDHTRLRKRLGKAFSNETTKKLALCVEDAVSELTSKMLSRSVFDFVEAFSAQLPIIVICDLLGLDKARIADIKQWSDTILSWRASELSDEKEKLVKQHMRDLYDFMIKTIEQKRRNPKDDVISSLVSSSDEDEELSLEDIISFIRMLLVAGTDTTTHLLGNTILAFSKFPEIYEEIRSKPDLIPDLIEESLRFDSPVQCVMRRARFDTTIGDKAIAKDEIVLAFIASANRDEKVYEQADQFIIARKSKQHLTFGAGIHGCMGAQIARMQTRIALKYFAQTIKEWQSEQDMPLQYFNSIFFRGVTKLLVKCEKI